MIPINNFDFLVGHWIVRNRRLKERLSACSEWIEFSAEMETKKIFNGNILMDEMKTEYFGDDFVGLSIRMYNPIENSWTIYWADTHHPASGIKEQVKGSFSQGIGTFYGEEIYKGKKVRLRFLWKKEDLPTAQWEQAYYDEARDQWETNWTMVFEPKK